MKRTALFLILLLISSLSAHSQVRAQATESQKEELERKRREKAERLQPLEVKIWEKRMRGWEKARMPARIFQKGYHGLRPVIGGMPSGSGFVFGGGYIRGLGSEFVSFQANARYSTKNYTQFDGLFEFPTVQSQRPVRGYLRAIRHDYKEVNFFGLGNESQRDDQSYFRNRGYSIVGGATAETKRVNLRGEFGRMHFDIRPGRRDPSLETVFDDVVGFGDGGTSFNVYGGRLDVDLLDHWGFPRVGAIFSLEGWRYDDQDLDQYDSVKVVLQAATQIPLGYRNRRLVYRFRTAHLIADRGHQEPFYLMETIGGANTIRGWHEFRFRDRRNLFMNLEYRWEIWHYADLAFFVDGGKVFREYDEFDLKGLKWGYGGGIRIHAPGGLSLNIDLAHSREGFVLHIGGGPRF